MNDTEQNNTNYVVDTILEMLYAKNPMFKMDEEKYKSKITSQYETFLMTSLLNQLNDDKREQFTDLLATEPFAKEKHNLFLKENVPNFEEDLIDVSKNFVKSYSELVKTM